MIVDLHCDTISRIREERRKGREVNLYRNNLHLDLCRMKEAGYVLQNFAIYIDSEEDPDVQAAYQEMYRIFCDEMSQNQSIIRQVKSYQDIEKNWAEGRMSALLTIEEGEVVNSVRNLEEAYKNGVRLITLTWNHKNSIGCPNRIQPDGAVNESIPNTTEGLTEYGRELVCRMEELGIAIDVSHLSDRGFLDVYETIKGPFLASHSNARELTPHVRNLTRDMIRKIGERGGIIGANFEVSFLDSIHGNGIESVVHHLEYIRQTGGMDCVALGSDFDGIDGNPELRGVQDMQKLEQALVKAGWTTDMCERLLYKNVFRFYREVLSKN